MKFDIIQEGSRVLIAFPKNRDEDNLRYYPLQVKSGGRDLIQEAVGSGNPKEALNLLGQRVADLLGAMGIAGEDLSNTQVGSDEDLGETKYQWVQLNGDKKSILKEVSSTDKTALDFFSKIKLEFGQLMTWRASDHTEKEKVEET